MKIFDYEEVKMNWDSFTYPIAVGTPVSIDGILADNASAHGLIARTVFAKPDADETLKVMTGGFIDMEEIVAGYGQELSSAAVNALCGIHFYKNGVCIPTGGNGDGSDDQKWHETGMTQLFSETVSIVDEYGRELEYADIISQDTIVVTFDGVEYTCPVNAVDGVYEYGAPYDSETDSVDYSEYPFSITSGSDGNYISTENIGTHTVSVSAEITTYTDAFKGGVNANVIKEVNNISEADLVVVEFPQRTSLSVPVVSVDGNSSQATVSIMGNAYEHILTGQYLFFRNTYSSFSCDHLTLFVNETNSELTINIAQPPEVVENNGVYTFSIVGNAFITLNDSNSVIKYYSLGLPRLSAVKEFPII